MNATMTKTCDCPKCDGKGHIAYFGHVAQGVCFRCKGTGQVVARKPSKPRVVKIAPRPLARYIGTGATYIDRFAPEKGIKPFLPAFEDGGVMCTGMTLEEMHAICDRYNAGEVWE